MMIEYMTLGLILIGMIYCAQGQPFTISTKFLNGKLIFTWSNISTLRNDITITKDSQRSPWRQVYDDQYTVEDVMRYKSVTITVREYSQIFRVYMVYNKTYNVNTIESKEGESRNVSWTVEDFPRSGLYFIFHAYNGSVSRIISIDNALPPPTEKYIYHTRLFNSTNILFEVRNITVEDAGYYVGSPTAKNPLSGEGGLVLIVFGKPLKPIITVNPNVTWRSYAILKCESRSTSGPDYYKKFPPLSYSWFVNNTRLDGENRTAYRFIVFKDIKYHRYSCQAKETLESERSEEIRINPFYGPKSVIITPQPPNNELSIQDGDVFGPYTCSADCNPPCTLQWKYKNPSGGFKNFTSIGFSSVTLQKQTANRTTMASIRCVAINAEGRNKSNINLNIQYFLDPKVYINGKPQNTLKVNERNPLVLSCFVEGNPTPEVALRKLTGNQIITQSVDNWLNYTLNREVQCSDTSVYMCEGKSTEFGSKIQSFNISVLCGPRLDESTLFETNYGSMSGPDVYVVVAVPVIANPLPSVSRITWSGPSSLSISTEVSQRDNIIYKHWINSSIPILDQRSFGNYSMKYKGKAVVDITVNTEDKPHPPLNFIGYSYASGYINFIWLSNYNGGPEQFFILSQKKGSRWIKVTNLTDPGEGNIGYYDLGPLNPGQEHWYQLESCNRINCSSRPAEVKVKVQGGRTDLKEPCTQKIWIVIGVLAALSLLLLTNIGVYQFARRRAVGTGLTPSQPSSDLKIMNKENDEINDVTAAAPDQDPPQTYEDIVEKCTEQSMSLADYQNASLYPDNQYEELKSDGDRFYTSLNPQN